MSIRRYITVVVLSLLSVSLATSSYAVDIEQDSFTPFAASSTEGTDYLYLKAKDNFVLLASEIIIPINIGSDTPSYQLLTGDITALEGQYLDARISNIPEFSQKASLQYQLADVTGDGIPEMFIENWAMFITGLAEEHGTTPQVLSQYEQIDGNQITYYDPITGQLMLKPGIEFELDDRNGDGRADLIISQPGKSPLVAEADEEGRYIETSTDPLTLSPELQSATFVTGAIAGSMGVDQGSASYVIPINAPAGTAGVNPKISFTYSDSGPNGLLGLGWSVSGLSQVTRCSKDLYTDGMNSVEWYNSGAEMDYTLEQHLCLDGERLVAVSGEYWASGTEYRLENESFSKVIQHGDISSASVWFEVSQKSGDVIHYGKSYSNISTNAKIKLGGGRVTAWMMSRVEDAAGNYMAYVYDSESAGSGYPVISKILYTGTNEFDPYNAIEFEYETRTHQDWSETYSPNSHVHFTQRKRLNKVVSYAEGYVYRAYHLVYEQSVANRASMLAELYECNGHNECLQPTKFEWEDKAPSYTLTSGPTYNFFKDDEINVSSDYKTLQYPDVNNDGFTDVCGRTKSGVACILGTNSGFNGNRIATSICKDGGSFWTHSTDYIGLDSVHYEDGCNETQYYESVRFIDVNGDGQSDIVWRNAEGIHYSLYEVGGYVKMYSATPLSSNMVGIAAKGGNDGGGNNDSDNFDYIFFPDINGDMLPEICYRHDVYGMRCFWNTGDEEYVWNYADPINTGFCENPSVDPSNTSCDGRDNWDSFNFIDLNADGMDDFFLRSDEHGIAYFFSTGDGFSEEYWYSGYCADGSDCHSDGSYKAFQFPDINGDGLADYCWKSAGHRYYCKANAKNFFDVNEDSTILSHYLGKNPFVASFTDLNGDGRSDLFYLLDDFVENSINLKSGLAFLINYRQARDTERRYKFYNQLTGEWETYQTNVCKTGCVVENANQSSATLATIALIDTNGDSKRELVMRTPNGIKTYHFDIPAEIGVIKAVENGFGLRTEVEYKPMNDSSVYDGSSTSSYPVMSINSGMSLVSEIRTMLPGLFEGQRWVADSTTYLYRGFMTHAKGIGSLGFSKIIETKKSHLNFLMTDSITETVETTYNTDPYSHAKGEIVETKSFVEGTLKSQSFNRYKTIIFDKNDNIVSGRSTIYESNQGLAIDGYRYFTYPEWSAIETFDYDTGVMLDAQINYSEYGRFGNLLSSTQWVQSSEAITKYFGVFVDITPEESTHHYKTHTTNYYDHDKPDAWYLGKLSRAVVTKSGLDAFGDIVSPITRQSEWEYDATTGAVKMEKVLKSDGTADTVAYYEVDTSHKGSNYPYFGIRNRSTTYEVVDGQEVNPRTSVSFSDPKGRYTVLEVDTLGQEVHTSYDPVQGVKRTVIDPSGFLTTFDHDNWGRVTQQTNPDGTWSTSKIFACGEGDMQCPSGFAGVPVTYYIKSTASGSGSQYAFMDLLGRQVKSMSQGYDGRFISVISNLDALGRVISESQPFYEGETKRFTSYHYDVLGRPRIINHPGGQDFNYYDQITDYETFTVSMAGGLVQQISYEGRNITYTNYFKKAGGGQKTQVVKEFFDVANIKYQTLDMLGNYVEFRFDAYGNKLETKGRYTENFGASHDSEYIISMAYDEMGRKTSMSDPSKGDWRYVYSKRGELVLQEDANAIKICNVYDSAGRMIRRYDNYVGSDSQALNHCEGGILPSAEWVYDSAPRVGGGAWSGKLHQILGENGYKETYYYDELGRVSNVVVEIDGNVYTTTTVYDEFGRVQDTYYPSANMANRLKVSNEYNSFGYLTKIKDHEGVPYWELEHLNASGNVTGESFSNGAFQTWKTYDPNNGTIKFIQSQRLLGQYGDLQKDSYQFNGIGSLHHREMTNAAGDYHLKETYSYDNINRLTEIQVTDYNLGTSATQSMVYSANGNIKNKYDIGEYSYGANDSSATCQVGGVTYTPSDHAVMSVAGQKNANYCYDNVGNLLEGDGRTVAWTPFNKPWRITRGNNSVEISYGPDRSRYKRVDSRESEVTRYTYVGGAYERIEKSSGELEEKFYIGGFAVVSVRDQGFNDLTKHSVDYLLKDHLGSVVGTVNPAKYDSSSASISFEVERMAYDPWGKRRNFLDWSAMDFEEDSIVAFAQTTNRGFTGHEMMDPVGLIHMNGRVYDPELGRFLSADPFVQSPDNSQSLNRYAYVMNNPVSFTDPSGFFLKSALKKLKKAWKRLKRRIKALRNRLKKLWRKIRDLHIKAFDEIHHYDKKLFKKTGEVLVDNPILGTIARVVACIPPWGAVTCVPVNAYVSAAQSFAVTGSWDQAFKAGAKAGAIAFLQGGGMGTDWGGVYGNIAGIGKAMAASHGAMVANSFLVGAHMMAGGTFSKLGGGSFRDGMLSAGISKMIAVGGGYGALSGDKGLSGIATRTTAAAIVGGTISKLTGGKFANGALTSAMAHLFNYESKESFGNKSMMTVNKDGHWQVRENAALAAAGLDPSTSTHSCSPIGLAGCAMMGTIAGQGGDTYTDSLDAANTLGTEGAEMIDIKVPLKVEALQYFSTAIKRFENNLKVCGETCGKQAFER